MPQETSGTPGNTGKSGRTRGNDNTIMSRIPTPSYGYPVPRTYYYDTELQEYPDSDVEQLHPDATYAWQPTAGREMIHREAGPPEADVTELYRRKSPDQAGRYVLAPQPTEYYYHPTPITLTGYRPRMSRIGPMTADGRPVTPHPAVIPPPRALSPAYYASEEAQVRAMHHATVHHPGGHPMGVNAWPHDVIYQPTHVVRPGTTQMVRRSVPQQPIAQQQVTNRPRNKAAVSVRTPRFYRRPATSDMYRRVSALCLPLASQPDPATRSLRAGRTSASMALSHGAALHSPSRDIQREMRKLRANTNGDVIPIIETTERCENDDYDTDAPQNTNVKALLNHYQKVFDECTEADDKSVKTKCSIISHKSNRKSKKVSPLLLKPKLPPSLLKPRQKIQRSNSTIKRTRQIIDSETSNCDDSKIDLEPMTTEAFDRMLNELTQSEGSAKEEEVPKKSPMKMKEPSVSEKNVNNSRSVPNRKSKSKLLVETNLNEDRQKDHQQADETPTSLNYAELSKYLNTHPTTGQQPLIPNPQTVQPTNSSLLNRSKPIFSDSQQNMLMKQIDASRITRQSFADNIPSDSSTVNEGLAGREGTDRHPRTKKSPWTTNSVDQRSAGDAVNQKIGYHADDNSAIEIHQSKSYIVNLIDRALSREFRTMPEDRNPSKFVTVNVSEQRPQSFSMPHVPTPAVVSVSNLDQPQIKMDNDLCLEIKQALTDSSLQQRIATVDALSVKDSGRDSDCNNGEESNCIKQLKKLRYGHMKHIQREMRKLEDLERFIDSYAGTETSP